MLGGTQTARAMAGASLPEPFPESHKAENPNTSREAAARDPVSPPHQIHAPRGEVQGGGSCQRCNFPRFRSLVHGGPRPQWSICRCACRVEQSPRTEVTALIAAGRFPPFFCHRMHRAAIQIVALCRRRDVNGRELRLAVHQDLAADKVGSDVQVRPALPQRERTQRRGAT